MASPPGPSFLVAPDSFKGTFTAAEVAAAIAAGVEAGGGEVERCPVADGGEGTMAVLLEALGGEERVAHVHDPLRRPIAASFGMLADGESAIVEVAQASGLPLLAPQERDPERADTYGTGELIAAAVAAGASRVLVAAGGSATTDGGRGAIAALRQSDAAFVLRTPSELQRTNATGREVSIELLCDVRTPFEDAARVFGPQKGADAAAVERLAARLEAFATELPRDPRGVPMGGCAGGLSGGLWAYGAELRPGAEFVLDALDFDARLARADAVISGEGRFDSQSLGGKIVGAIAAPCAATGKPLYLIVGENRLADRPPGVASVSEAEGVKEIQRVATGLAIRWR
ncbi:MAG TPA: glycerate kinase [Solirubrobacterales bacterium]|nr:glycerate kinase [Solirubrobacterales bacterium]